MTGLLVLVVVGAWLAVLVPMALRSHDTTSFKSSERYSDAMRVLSRKTSRDVLVPRRSYSSLVVSETKSTRAPRIPEERVEDVAPVPAARRTAAERRLRTLLVLLGTALVSLGLALLGVPLMSVVQVVCDLLLVAFVVHCRRQALLRPARPAARAAGAPARPARATAPAAPAARPAAPARRTVRIAGIPDRMPPRPAPLTSPLPAPAARYEDKPVAATGTDGTWSPTPVPPPTYVGKATAPRREPRVLDLTKPGEWTATLEGDDAGLGILDDGTELDDILTRRRAVGD